MPTTIELSRDQQHLLDLAKRILNELGFDASMPQLIAVFRRNVVSGRVSRLMQEKTDWRLDSYLMRMAQTYQSESTFVEALRAGREKAQAEFWQQALSSAYEFLIYRGVSPREAQEQACDAAQDTWLAIRSGRAHYPYDVAFSRWSKTVLHNHLWRAFRQCRDTLDRRDVVMLDAADGDWLEYFLPHDNAGGWGPDTTMPILEQAFGAVSPRQRISLRLFYLEGQPAKDVAETLNCTEAAVNTHCYRGRKRMLRFFHQRGLGLNDLLPARDHRTGNI